MFIVKTLHNGEGFYLRRTIFSAYRDRATVFATREEAAAMLNKARQFNKARVCNAAVIIELLTPADASALLADAATAA